MTRSEYLQALRAALSFLDAAALDTAVNFYDEMIEDRMEDGMSEEAAVASLEAPETIAAKMREEEPPAPAAQPEEGGESAEDETGWEKKTAVYPAAAIRAVALNAADMGVHVHAAPGDQATLTYYTSKTDVYTPQLENGVLTLDHVRRGSMVLIFTGKSAMDVLRGLLQGTAKPAIELALPADTLADLTVSTTNARIRVEQMAALCSVQLHTTNGKLALENVQCKTLEGSTTNGRLTLRGVNCRQSLHMTATNGSVNAQDVQSGGDLALITTNSGMTAQTLAARGGLRLETKNGAIHAETLRAGVAAALITSNAAVDADHVDAPRVTLRTSNGAIRGWLPGRQADWQIDSHTSSYCGNSLPESAPGSGGRALCVRTSNGGIDVRFTEE